MKDIVSIAEGIYLSNKHYSLGEATSYEIDLIGYTDIQKDINYAMPYYEYYEDNDLVCEGTLPVLLEYGVSKYQLDKYRYFPTDQRAIDHVGAIMPIYSLYDASGYLLVTGHHLDIAKYLNISHYAMSRKLSHCVSSYKRKTGLEHDKVVFDFQDGVELIREVNTYALMYYTK